MAYVPLVKWLLEAGNDTVDGNGIGLKQVVNEEVQLRGGQTNITQEDFNGYCNVVLRRIVLHNHQGAQQVKAVIPACIHVFHIKFTT